MTAPKPTPPPLQNQPAAVESSAPEPSGMDIAQREADEAAGDADPRDRVCGPSPDWLSAQRKFQQAGRPKPRPKSSYAFQPRKGK
jgi:hypothetical protein